MRSRRRPGRRSAKQRQSRFFGALAPPLGGLELVHCTWVVVACVPGSGDVPLGPTLVIGGDSVVTGGNVPVVETGDDGTGIAVVGARLIVETDDDGIGVALSPPPPICTEPNGIPVRETPLGDEDDIAADEDAAPLVLVLHVPDVAAPPGNGVPVPTPNPPPSKFVLEPEAPADGLPMAEHIVPVPVIPAVSASEGLSPGDASSVAPMGRPTGGTDEPGVMLSGEVAPIPGVGLPIPPICANTGLQPKSAAIITAINARLIVTSIVPVERSGRRVSPDRSSRSRRYRPGQLGNAFMSCQNASDESGRFRFPSDRIPDVDIDQSEIRANAPSAVEMRDRWQVPSVPSTYARATYGGICRCVIHRAGRRAWWRMRRYPQ